MFSMDTNLLLHALNEDSPSHEAAFGWLTAVQHEEDVAISAPTMTMQGVTEFATVNVKDYEGLGFRKV